MLYIYIYKILNFNIIFLEENREKRYIVKIKKSLFLFLLSNVLRVCFFLLF